jgi:hypothetical protein
MAKSFELGYERKPPIGNALIDDEAGTVLIRIFPDRTLGRISSWAFAALGLIVLLWIGLQVFVGGMSFLQGVPTVSLAMLFFLLALIMRYDPRRGFTTILASSTGVEYSVAGFTPRNIQRSKIQRIFTRDVPMSKRLSLCVRMVDGSDMIVGSGEKKEIEAMARALHKVLNATDHGERSDD